VTRDSLVPGGDGAEAFARHVRPELMERLRAIGLDVEYHRGEGDRLFHRDPAGNEAEVLDLVGGFGAGLLGHNHPAIVARAREILEAGRPFHAQASARPLAGELGRRLSGKVGAITGREYVATFAGSGTEAVEGALKHAELERVRRGEALLAELRERIHELRLQVREGRAHLGSAVFRDVEERTGTPSVGSLEEMADALLRTARDVVERPPLFLALERAFHGKTTGSLRLTAGREYRTPWRHLGPRTLLLPVGGGGDGGRAPGGGGGGSGAIDALQAALRGAIAQETRHVPFPEVAPDGAVVLGVRTVTGIAGCFVEPIQGEGGIREIPAEVLALLREAADAHGFPLVMDEIQSGMGRTGDFLASQASGVRGDYYLLSKSLGGGMAKISALLVDRERYMDDFGYLHTSTFADDDFSCGIALKVLDLLEADGGVLLQRVRERGAYFLSRLEELQMRYPGQLRAVRGRGLMIGIELAPPWTRPRRSSGCWPSRTSWASSSAATSCTRSASGWRRPSPPTGRCACSPPPSSRRRRSTASVLPWNGCWCA
jgi:acetylornithine/succinyldiaminopimelate/putrescine aminotransferase